jgi:hypothetical protein
MNLLLGLCRGIFIRELPQLFVLPLDFLQTVDELLLLVTELRLVVHLNVHFSKIKPVDRAQVMSPMLLPEGYSLRHIVIQVPLYLLEIAIAATSC